MEISPAWRGRYADSYQVLQMHPDYMVTPPPISHHQHQPQSTATFEKKMGSNQSSRKEKKKASNLAEEERISNLSEVQLNQGSRSKNNSRLLMTRLSFYLIFDLGFVLRLKMLFFTYFGIYNDWLD